MTMTLKISFHKDAAYADDSYHVRVAASQDHFQRFLDTIDGIDDDSYHAARMEQYSVNVSECEYHSGETVCDFAFGFITSPIFSTISWNLTKQDNGTYFLDLEFRKNREADDLDFTTPAELPSLFWIDASHFIRTVVDINPV